MWAVASRKQASRASAVVRDAVAVGVAVYYQRLLALLCGGGRSPRMRVQPGFLPSVSRGGRGLRQLGRTTRLGSMRVVMLIKQASSIGSLRTALVVAQIAGIVPLAWGTAVGWAGVRVRGLISLPAGRRSSPKMCVQPGPLPSISRGGRGLRQLGRTTRLGIMRVVLLITTASSIDSFRTTFIVMQFAGIVPMARNAAIGWAGVGGGGPISLPNGRRSSPKMRVQPGLLPSISRGGRGLRQLG